MRDNPMMSGKKPTRHETSEALLQAKMRGFEAKRSLSAAALRPGSLIWFSSAFLLAILAGTALALFLLWRDAVHNQHGVAQRVVRLLAEHAVRTVEPVERALQAARKTMLAEGVAQGRVAPERVTDILRAQAQTGSQVVRLLAVDASDHIYAASIPLSQPRVAVPDRELMQALRDGKKGDGLYVGLRVTSSTAAEPAFALALRVVDPQTGAYRGALIASVEAAHFERLYDSLDFGSYWVLLLLRDDSAVLAAGPRRSLESPVAVRAVDVPRLMMQASEDGPPQNEVLRWTIAATDEHGKAHAALVGIHALSTYPLFAAVVIDMDAALAPWRARVLTLGGGAVLSSVFVLALTALSLWFSSRSRGLGFELLRARGRYQALVENSPDGIVLAREGVIQYANGAMHRLARTGPGTTLIGQRLDILVDGYGQTSQQQPAHNTEFSGKPPRELVVAEHWMHPAQGEQFEVETVTTPAASPDDETVQVMVRDVSIRKRTETQLRASEERYRLMVDGVPDCAVLLLDEEGAIEHVHPITGDLILGERASFAKAPFANLFAQADVDTGLALNLLKDARAQRATQRSVERDGWIRRSDGSLFWGHLVLASLTDAQQRSRGFQVTVRDITWRKRLQDQLDLSLRQLEQLTLAVESERENEKLRIARELHDELGQNLTALKLDLDLLETMLPVSDKQAHARAGAMRQTLDGMVKTARRIAGDLRPLVLDDLGLEAGIEWLADQFEARSPARCQVSVSGPRPDELPRAVSTAIFRIAQESLTNIARHARAQTVRIALEYIRESGHDSVRLRVSDDGCGIAHLPKAGTENKGYGLLGIGERARLLGGQARITSRPGEGTEINVSLPLHGAAESVALAGAKP